MSYPHLGEHSITSYVSNPSISTSNNEQKVAKSL